MKKILAFKGVLFNQDKIDSMAQVVSPPYDVINPELQQQLFDKSENNFCRLDLPKGEGDARYEEAERVFKDWIDNQVLLADKSPALYIHHHTFTLPDGRKITRKGFFAARRIEDFS